MSSPNVVQKTSVVVVQKEEGKDEVDFIKGVKWSTKSGFHFDAEILLLSILFIKNQ